jgi:hypothetical protein
VMTTGRETETVAHRRLWYRRFRAAAFLSTLAALVWTLIIVLPFEPFSYLPPIIVGGGPGIWFVLAYVLFVITGIGGFGTISGILTTVELHEGRTVDGRLMWPALALMCVGIAGSCILLGVAGAVGGYASTIQLSSTDAIKNLLAPYVNPITTLVMIAVIGAALAVLSMVRARWPGP